MSRSSDAAGEHDRAIVGAQIGRPARGEVTVVAHCSYGLPLVVRTSPTLDDGTPFPTLYYLTCPVAVRAASKLESEGFMVGLNERLTQEPELAAEYLAAHTRYRQTRDEGAPGPAMSAGGMPRRVKCLHALYAHEVADANPIGAIVRDHIEPLDCPGPCVKGVTDDTEGEPVVRVAGHPGYKRRRP